MYIFLVLYGAVALANVVVNLIVALTDFPTDQAIWETVFQALFM